MKRTASCLIVGLAIATGSTTALAQTLARASVSSSGLESTATGGFIDGSFYPSVSDDGRYVVFQSNTSNLIDGEPVVGTHIYLRDRVLGQTTLISRNPFAVPASGVSELPKISADGSTVVYQSSSTDLVDGDTNASIDVFVWDRATGVTSRASTDSFSIEANNNSSDTYGPAISANGRYVAFTSTASNLITLPGGGANRAHIYRHDNLTGETIRISLASGAASAPGTLLSTTPSISGDGNKVAFRSAASNLVTGDTNGISDAFVRTVSNGTTIRASLTSAGAQITSGTVAEPSISRDGGSVVFTHTGNLTGAATTQPNVYLRQITAGTTSRISTQVVAAPTGGCYTPIFSGDGNFIAFSSWDSGRIIGDTNGSEDIFIFNRAAATTRRISLTLDGTQANLDSFSPALNFDGTVIAFDSIASNLVAADTNEISDIFVFDNTPVIPTCLADITGDSIVDGSDFIAFINSFSSGDVTLDPIADVNHDLIIDGNDFTAFINAFAAGC